MEAFCFSFSTSPHLSLHPHKHHPSPPSTATPISFSLQPSPESNDSPSPIPFRRPSKPLEVKTTTTPPPSIPKTVPTNLNPLKYPFNSSNSKITNKLWLTSKLSPPPPPPPLPPPTLPLEAELEDEISEVKDAEVDEVENSGDRTQFRQPGKIFVGNLPAWVKKHEFSEFFRQFGPIKNVILIRGHNDTERNAGFGFVIYDGETAESSAMKAVEFDGVEFHGRVLTVKLDDGKRLREKSLERAKWLHGNDEKEYRSTWHEERDGSRKEFQRVLETEPENWQAVVRAFEKIKKVGYLNFSMHYVYVSLFHFCFGVDSFAMGYAS